MKKMMMKSPMVISLKSYPGSFHEVRTFSTILDLNVDFTRPAGSTWAEFGQMYFEPRSLGACFHCEGLSYTNRNSEILDFRPSRIRSPEWSRSLLI